MKKVLLSFVLLTCCIMASAQEYYVKSAGQGQGGRYLVSVTVNVKKKLPSTAEDLVMKYAVKTGAEPASSSGSSSSSSCSARSPSSESSFSADETGFASPWPEHGIEFDQDVIKSRGYVASKQDVLSGVKGYKFFK